MLNDLQYNREQLLVPELITFDMSIPTFPWKRLQMGQSRHYHTCLWLLPFWLSALFLHGLRGFTLGILFLFGGALVMLLLALGEADFQFDAAVFVVHVQRH
jgi:hypothetical protein